MQCSTTACDSSRARPRHRYTCTPAAPRLTELDLALSAASFSMQQQRCTALNSSSSPDVPSFSSVDHSRCASHSTAFLCKSVTGDRQRPF